MQRKHMAFEQLFDVRAVRIIVDTVAECYAALGVVHNLWPFLPSEFDDYIATPKDNNYRSIHTAVSGPDGRPLEVQIRTRDMQSEAELGVAVALALQGRRREPPLRREDPAGARTAAGKQHRGADDLAQLSQRTVRRPHLRHDTQG